MEQKKINRNIIFSVVAVLLLVIVVAGATYAYFSATASTDVQTVTTGSLTMGFTNGDIVRADGLAPIADSEIKTKAAELDFSVTNTGTEHMNLTISLTDIVIPDALKDVDFRWGLYNKDTGVGLSFGIFKDIGTATSMVIYRDTIIDAVLDENEPDITNNYTLRVWIHDDGALQNYMQGQTFSAKVTVDGEAVQYTDEDCFTFNNGTITEYDEATCGTDVVIPKTIDGITVTSIDDSAFVYTEDGIGITSIIIPNSVTNFSFQYTSCNSLTIPESVTTLKNIGEGSFENIYIPESVTSLDALSTGYNPINSLILPGSLSNSGTHEPSGDVYTVILMDGITEIPEYAFGMFDFEEIEIPASVTTIESMAFAENPNLTKIILRGKTSVPDTFDENWNSTGEGNFYNVEFRP